MNSRDLLILAMAFGLLLCACGATSRVASDEAGRDFEVTASERQQAVDLAQGTDDFRYLTAAQPVYFVDVEVLRDKEAEVERGDAARQILVTHYAAGTDAAILSRVNLESRRVVAVETVPHLPVRLSQEEFEMARRLALEDPRVQAALEGRDVEVEAQLSRTADEKDPQYRHRVVHFLFKTPDGYLDSPTVIVDLTAGLVVVE
jgi:Cu2+-containing amine oxidase